METVEIGTKRLPVVPQRHARLRRKLNTEDFARLMSAEYSHEAYRLLGILIPDLHDPEKGMPEHEWDGFAREEEWKKWKKDGVDNRPEVEADAEDELSPTTDQIINAFEVAFKVSGAGRMGKIVDLILQGQRMTQGQAQAPTQSLPVSPGENGEST